MDIRTRGQRWADNVTEFSGSWTFIGWFAGLSAVWIAANLFLPNRWDPYPFLFLNWLLTVVSTFQSPLILLSQNRQNENDRETTEHMLAELRALRVAIEEMKRKLP